MKIEVGKYEVISSGSIIQINDQDIKLTFADEDDTNVVLVIKFNNDSSVKEPTTKYNALDTYHMEIIFSNFNDVTGIANTETITLGTLQKREWLFNYRIYAIGTLGKLFHYTFYLGEEAKNG